MAVLNMNGHPADDGLLRIWGTIAELSEQLSQHRAFTASLQAQIGVLKSQAVHSRTGFPLRRFNLDKPKEAYEAELERMTSALKTENHALADDNKQLGALIKEYEQTLEGIMATFRKRAHEVQERELALIRDYEAKLLKRESEDLTAGLAASSAASGAIARLSEHLRATVRAELGEDARAAALFAHPGWDGAADADEDGEWTEARVADWAVDREAELLRLERENEELRRLAGVLPPAPPVQQQQQQHQGDEADPGRAWWAARAQ